MTANLSDVSADTGQVMTRPGIGLLARLKLTEPVRLYLYSLALVAIAGLQLAGYLTGDWVQYALTDSAVVLGVAGAGAEAARASVYSPAGVVRELRKVAR
jgi:hypothetical protein